VWSALPSTRQQKQKYKKKLKQTNGRAHLVQYRFKIREGSPERIRVTMEGRICEMKEMSFKSGVKG